ncbi:MAG: alpha/beta hydrolase [Bacteroidetes bacterium]|nr:alpha/beta hydrolase [Bacteroidota bacterium]MDF2452106.1 alpha/beta hydrolase [Bacteroidota bacterium]
MKLAFREFGSGQPLIILHGLFGQSDNWNTLAKRFAEKGFHVFTLDLRNHGLSPHSEVWNYEVMAADVKVFIDDKRLADPVLLGHSMGGKTLLFFERLFPHIAQKLIIADIAPRAYEPHHDSVLKALNAVDFSEINTRKDAEAILGQYITDFGTKQFLLKNIYWREDETKQMDWRFDLKTITTEYNNIGVAVPHFKSDTPALFIRGEKSNYISEADEKEIATYFPDYILKTIDNSGHWVHAEQPEAFLNCVLEFIT